MSAIEMRQVIKLLDVIQRKKKTINMEDREVGKNQLKRGSTHAGRVLIPNPKTKCQVGFHFLGGLQGLKSRSGCTNEWKV